MSLKCDDSHCEHANCQRMADFSCDFPQSNGRPCGRRLCAIHAHPVSQNTDYCTKHHTEVNRNKEEEVLS